MSEHYPLTGSTAGHVAGVSVAYENQIVQRKRLCNVVKKAFLTILEPMTIAIIKKQTVCRSQSHEATRSRPSEFFICFRENIEWIRSHFSIIKGSFS